MATYTETIELKDQVSSSAKAAKGAISDLQGGLEAAQKDLVKMAALGNQAGYNKALKSAMDYSAALAKIPPVQAAASAAPPTAPLVQAGTAATNLAKSTFDAAQAIAVGKETIGAAIDGIKTAFRSLASGDIQGAVAGVTDAVAGMSKALDLVVPGLGEVVSAVVKIAGGLVGITVGLIQSGMKFAIAAATEKQAMISMFDAMGAGVVTGRELDDMLSELADSIGISKDKLAPLTKAFLQMGITGKDQLEQLTKAAISATAIVGEGGAEAFENLTKKIQLAAQTGSQLKIDNKFLKTLSGAGLTIDDVAKALGTTSDKLKDTSVDAAKLGDALTKGLIDKGAKPLERMGMSIDNIWGKFLQDVGDWFEDIDVGPFLKEVKDLFGIFATSKPSGEALKSGIQGFFQKTFDIAAKLVPIVKHFLLDVIIYGLKAYIALKPIVATLTEWYQKASELGIIGAIFKGIGVAALVVAGVILLVVGVIGTLMAISVAVGVIIWTLIAAFMSLGATIMDAVISAGGAVLDWLMGLGVSINDALGGWPAMAVQAALDFIQGLVNGISQGAGLVADAAKGVASGAVDAVTGFLGIKSPSTVMAEIGGHTATGMAQGIESSAGGVHGAASGLATAAVTGAAPANDNGGGGARGGIQVTNYIQVDGAGKAAEEITDEVVTAAWERVALAAGV